MAYTAPTQRTESTLITASIYNTDLVDNIAYLKGEADKLTFLGARATLAATLDTTVSGAGTLVHLDTETFDIGADFDKDTTHLYTIPVTGYYQINAQIMFDHAVDGKSYEARIYIDGVNTIWSSQIPGTNSIWVTCGISDMNHFTAGQTIGLYYYHDDATTTDLEAEGTYLSIHLVSTG
jgi:hypothetical protein